jgi:hypothetical protein
MPKVSTSKTEEEAIVVAPRKRAPRKRAPVDGETPAPRSRVRKTAVRHDDEPSVRPEPSDEHQSRRAPTPLKAQRLASKRNTNSLVIGLVGLAIGIGAGVGIGYSDNGQIDVVAVVNERNEKINRVEVRGDNGESVTQTVPVQNTDTRPNGGLVPMETPSAPATSETPAATTTPVDATATSSDSASTSTATTTEATS